MLWAGEFKTSPAFLSLTNIYSIMSSPNESSNKVEQLNELHLNLLGKIFLVAVGAWMVGKSTNLKIRGTPQEVATVARALQSSKVFQDELKRSGATVQSVMARMQSKQLSAQEFERIFGVRWPL